MTIVSLRTFARWVSGETKSVGTKAKRGRRRTEEQLRELIVTVARDLGAGYTRVMGELPSLTSRWRSRGVSSIRLGSFHRKVRFSSFRYWSILAISRSVAAASRTRKDVYSLWSAFIADAVQEYEALTSNQGWDWAGAFNADFHG